MPTITEQPYGLLMELDHQETQDLVSFLSTSTDVKAIGAKLAALGVSAFASPIVAAALALHVAWEVQAIRMSDKGQGVFLTYPLYGLLAPGVVIPSTRHVQDVATDWAGKADGVFASAEGDLVSWHVDRGATDPSVVAFRLVDECGWDKAFVLRDGTGGEWTVTAPAHGSAENGLWSQQVQNHQQLTFRKPKFLGIWADIFSVGSLDLLLPGDVVTFTWTQD
ncbi:hypothetical protein EV648_11547 [Kribbella sp. VKM Ac-2568]|jgi:hypothetical protein|nr:hypothetical protein EV648_11547 [Kribbella sp. VKM Ac-2568]